MENKPIKVASFFAGIGGFDLGFEKAGAKVVWQCEVNPYCLDVLKAHWPNVPRSKDIKTAYHRRCVVCGLELPKTGMGRSGIEAAHILPWADFDLDVVTNGLALCRNHHWAFDSRVITLVCNDARRNTYILRPGDHYEEFTDECKNACQQALKT